MFLYIHLYQHLPQYLFSWVTYIVWEKGRCDGYFYLSTWWNQESLGRLTVRVLLTGLIDVEKDLLTEDGTIPLAGILNYLKTESESWARAILTLYFMTAETMWPAASSTQCNDIPVTTDCNRECPRLICLYKGILSPQQER